MKKSSNTTGNGLFLADTHCHVIEGRREYADAGPVLRRAGASGVARMMLAGSDIPTSALAAETAAKYASLGVFSAAGVHPHEASSIPSCSKEGGPVPQELKALASLPGVIAIGETGLDYHYNYSPREQQIASFRAHIRWSVESGLPLIVHGRESYPDIVQIFREEEACRGRGVIHCFSGTAGEAEFFLEAGYYLSFAGPLTFARNEGLRKLFRDLPPDRILLETDSPFLAPVPLRGKRNEPAFVRYVYEKAAEVRGVPLEDLARAVSANAHSLFGWGDPYDEGAGK